MKCDGDCFNCKYEDCTNGVSQEYVDRLNELHREYARKWRKEHYEQAIKNQEVKTVKTPTLEEKHEKIQVYTAK